MTEKNVTSKPAAKRGPKKATAPAVEKELEVITRKYNDHDEIVCRSIVQGRLMAGGRKTKNSYSWANYGDVYSVEVCDLNAWKAIRSAFLYDPLIVIEDEEFLSQEKWTDIRELYEKAARNDLEEILNLSNVEFENALRTLPKGYKNSLISVISELIENNAFDSMIKVKLVDEICGTDLYSMLK